MSEFSFARLLHICHLDQVISPARTSSYTGLLNHTEVASQLRTLPAEFVEAHRTLVALCGEPGAEVSDLTNYRQCTLCGFIAAHVTRKRAQRTVSSHVAKAHGHAELRARFVRALDVAPGQQLLSLGRCWRIAAVDQVPSEAVPDGEADGEADEVAGGDDVEAREPGSWWKASALDFLPSDEDSDELPSRSSSHSLVAGLVGILLYIHE